MFGFLRKEREGMGIKINSFGGPLIWLLRKYNSAFTSKVMLTVASKFYSRSINEYIHMFMEQEISPIFQNVLIETINRCNGDCEFCPANKNAEIRPFKKMSDKMYSDIIRQLNEMNWHGNIFLCVNNEPFIDNRIISFARYAKDQIDGAKIMLISNGTLLNPSMLEELVGIVDNLVINDYSATYRLSERHRNLYQYVKKNRDKFSSISIIINRRYNKEILATRGGSAPNKQEKNNYINEPCIYPFLDMVIFPDGKVGLCCNDCYENTDFGDINANSLDEIWRNKKFTKIRESMQSGRKGHALCTKCDVVDAGGREKYIQSLLKDNKKIL